MISCNECDSLTPKGCLFRFCIFGKELKMPKQIYTNSSNKLEFAWTEEEQLNNDLPTECNDGSPIPKFTYGTNMDKGDIYFWTGSEWKLFGGE